MKREWSLIIVLFFAIIVAVFAVINVEPVGVDYVFGTAQWPLVLVILGSAMLGALTVGAAGSVRYLSMKRELRSLLRENRQMKSDFETNGEQALRSSENKENNEEQQEKVFGSDTPSR
ncbi:lipopolysaccharide assembly LapA domain-containing protein [Alkalihalobacillus sp. AL-G]|uniref:LapA family protein n=1 Tax=Alkalihalobacillus sp. AL-G TaxID=2926399 RepID=UPI00272A5515|nr:lipopolysaccharide assembly protein LapA domain-containing protein [Alkalihalobacillus sp. AL-G]WLD92211.1 lipopolysaccharide assembly protein LapA domain-containing protein [Alkalihalobacillus sp. AL-G]